MSDNKVKIHNLKIKRKVADAVHFGDKRIETRENISKYQAGDILSFTCIDDKGSQVYHPINIIQYRIIHMMNVRTRKDEYVVLKLEEIKEDITMDLINQRLDQKEV